jgi:predicted nucleic acid-binding protein
LPLFYVDSSALVKLLRDEPESRALRTFLADVDLVSCELVLTEIPASDPAGGGEDSRLVLDVLLARAAELLDVVGLVALDRPLLLAAGALVEPVLRALDAIHVVAAVELSPLDGFVTYDERQAAAARLAGLRTIAPRA